MTSISEKHKNLLDDIYYSPTGSFGSYSSYRPLYLAARKKDKSISLKIVKAYLLGNDSYLTHRRVLRKFERRSLLQIAPHDTWCLDYVVYLNDKNSNNNHVYCLNCHDTFSHKSWARSGSTKSAEQTLSLFKQILVEAGTAPKHLFTDQGGKGKIEL